MTRQPDLMTDAELDTLLAHASAPPLPLGARERLLARMAREVTGEVASEDAGPAQPSNVVRLRPPAASRPRLHWLAGLPLAASLALGIYLGNSDGIGASLPVAAYDMLAGVSTDDAVSGIEDIESFSEDDLS